jgi:hypothetical protein
MSDNIVKFSNTPVSEIDRQFLELEKQQKQIEEQRRQIEALKNQGPAVESSTHRVSNKQQCD